MAWQKDVGIGNYGSKLRVRVDLVSQNRAENRSYIRVRVYAYNGGSSRAYNLGSGANWSISGTVSASGSQTFSVAGHSWFTFVDRHFTVSHDSAGNLSLSIRGGISDTGTSTFGNGGAVTVSAALPRLVLAPAKPSWGGTAWTSDTTIRASWSNNATARAPYDRIDVQRFDGGRWWNHGRLAAGATSYTDSNIPGNDEIQYRVQAVGPGGVSGWTYGGTVGTVPASPTSVTARKSGSAIRVSWTDRAAPTNRTRVFYVQDNPGGTGWVNVGSIGGSATAWTHSDADPAVTHQYRVQARITTTGRTLSSSWSSASSVVQLLAAPGQPRRDAPSDSSTQVVGEALTFEWSHNPVDTTAQTAAEFQYRIDGGDWHTSTVGGDEHVTITPVVSGARAKLEWRVRTKGDHPDWSPWSTTNGPQLSTPPTVTVQSPDSQEELPTSRVAVSWVYDPNGTESQLGQSSWRVVLAERESGTVLETATGTTQDAVTLEHRLDNATGYTVTVTARNGDGLWSAAEVVQFSTDFPLPQPVLAFPVWDRDTAAVSIGFSVEDVPERTDVDAIDVERRDDGGSWVLIASGISTSTTVTDRTPRIGAVEYRAISRTVLPTETVGPTAVTEWVHDRDPVYVSGGAGFDRVCLARGSSASDDHSVEQTLHKFAGLSKPVAFFGPGQESATHFTGRIFPDYPLPTSTRDDWVRLLRQRGLVCFRDCTGRKMFGLLTVAFSTAKNVDTVEIDVTEASHTEGVRRVTDLELEAML